MREAIEISKCKNHGYNVDIYREREDGYDCEEYAFEHPLGVLAEVLQWLGYGEDAQDILEQLDGSATHVLTETGKKAAAEIARLKRGRVKLGSPGSINWTLPTTTPH